MDMGLWSERAAAGNAPAKLIHSDNVASQVSPTWRLNVETEGIDGQLYQYYKERFQDLLTFKDL